jgi:predicted metal-dependent phosphotriesterase family hydrolase
LALAERGAWIQIACLSEKNIKTVSTCLIEFKKRSLLNRLLISHGDGWTRDEAGFKRIDNGNNLPYDTLLRRLAPLLAPPIFSAEDFRLLAVENPRQAFALRKPTA